MPKPCLRPSRLSLHFEYKTKRRIIHHGQPVEIRQNVPAPLTYPQSTKRTLHLRPRQQLLRHNPKTKLNKPHYPHPSPIPHPSPPPIPKPTKTAPPTPLSAASPKGAARTVALGERFLWCLGPDLNRHGPVKEPQDFKSCASTNFATEA
jgi:hypothetical protein